MKGKHTDQGQEISKLKRTIELKDQEIKDIKTSIASVLQSIRNLNESNNFSDPSVIKRKISELCTDTIYQLLIDEIDGFGMEEGPKAKIIKLSTPNQSNR